MEHPLLSVIIPAYNEESTIEKTIRQFVPLKIPHEVIVSDSASTDRTAEIAHHYADAVITLPAGKRSGVSPARNEGVTIAKGDFLVFIDSDTTIPKGEHFFEILLDRFRRESKTMGMSARIEVNPRVATLSDRAVSFLMNIWFFFLNKCLGVGISSGKFMIVRKEAFKRTGGFDESMNTAEDVDLFRKLARFGHTRIVWPLAVYHEGRRFHRLGAWRTMLRWMFNSISYWIRGKSSDTWEPVR